MKVFVLGGDGFCGWPCAVNLADQGHDVLIVDNLSRRKIDIDLEGSRSSGWSAGVYANLSSNHEAAWRLSLTLSARSGAVQVDGGLGRVKAFVSGCFYARNVGR